MRKMFPLIVLLLHLSAVYSDSHSLRYYHTAVSAPGFGIPEYSETGYVDDREIMNYNSDSRKCRLSVEWMKKLGDDYWKGQTQNARGNEAIGRHNVKTAMERFNQSGGFHSVQKMYGCQLDDDGRITGYNQDRYDGEEFMALDTQIWTFIATMSQAQVTAQRWNSPEVQVREKWRNYLENVCIDWLKNYMENGREDLERRVPPQVKVSARDEDDAMTLHCLVYGFHPRHVDVKWMKNGVDDVPSYHTTHVLPNPDGTYQIRVSAEVIPKEGDSYSCYVDHSSLEAPLSIVWEPEQRSAWVTPVVVAAVAVAAVLLGGLGYLLYRRRCAGYKTTSTSDTSSESNSAKA